MKSILEDCVQVTFDDCVPAGAEANSGDQETSTATDRVSVRCGVLARCGVSVKYCAPSVLATHELFLDLGIRAFYHRSMHRRRNRISGRRRSRSRRKQRTTYPYHSYHSSLSRYQYLTRIDSHTLELLMAYRLHRCLVSIALHVATSRRTLHSSCT